MRNGVNGEAAFPQRGLKAQSLACGDSQRLERDPHFQHARKRALHRALRRNSQLHFQWLDGAVSEADGDLARTRAVQRLAGEARFHAAQFPLVIRVHVDAQVKVPAVGAEVNFLHQELLAVHGAAPLIDVVNAGAHPLEIGGDLAIDHRPDRPRGRHQHGGQRHAQDGARKLLGRHQVQEAVDVGEVAAVELVELRAVGGLVLRSVPPAPVAALGDEQLFISHLPFVAIHRGRGIEGLAGPQ